MIAPFNEEFPTGAAFPGSRRKLAELCNRNVVIAICASHSDDEEVRSWNGCIPRQHRSNGRDRGRVRQFWHGNKSNNLTGATPSWKKASSTG
jgi:hypothetical protein